MPARSYPTSDSAGARTFATILLSLLIKNPTNPTIGQVSRMDKRFLLVWFVVGFLTITWPMLVRNLTIGAKVRLLVGCWSGSETLTRP